MTEAPVGICTNVKHAITLLAFTSRWFSPLHNYLPADLRVIFALDLLWRSSTQTLAVLCGMWSGAYGKYPSAIHCQKPTSLPWWSCSCLTQSSLLDSDRDIFRCTTQHLWFDFGFDFGFSEGLVICVSMKENLRFRATFFVETLEQINIALLFDSNALRRHMLVASISLFLSVCLFPSPSPGLGSLHGPV